MTDDFRADRIGSSHRGENPTVLRRLKSGFAMIGETQFLPGYSLLLTDDPTIERLSDLPRSKRLTFLTEMDALAEAVERACRTTDPAFRRVNLEILGNHEPYLHAHIWPRFDWEPADLIQGPVWLYPRENWTAPHHTLGPRHNPLRLLITDELTQLLHNT